MSTTEARPERPASRRRWFQYSLRTLMLIVLLCAIACSWFASKMQEVRKQREADEAFRKGPRRHEARQGETG